jgi:hypothetical protein
VCHVGKIAERKCIVLKFGISKRRPHRCHGLRNVSSLPAALLVDTWIDMPDVGGFVTTGGE